MQFLKMQRLQNLFKKLKFLKFSKALCSRPTAVAFQVIVSKIFDRLLMAIERTETTEALNERALKRKLEGTCV